MPPCLRALKEQDAKVGLSEFQSNIFFPMYRATAVESGITHHICVVVQCLAGIVRKSPARRCLSSVGPSPSQHTPTHTRSRTHTHTQTHTHNVNKQ